MELPAIEPKVPALWLYSSPSSSCNLPELLILDDLLGWKDMAGLSKITVSPDVKESRLAFEFALEFFVIGVPAP